MERARFLGAAVVTCCWPFKTALECAILSDSTIRQKSQNRQGYSTALVKLF